MITQPTDVDVLYHLPLLLLDTLKTIARLSVCRKNGLNFVPRYAPSWFVQPLGSASIGHRLDLCHDGVAGVIQVSQLREERLALLDESALLRLLGFKNIESSIIIPLTTKLSKMMNHTVVRLRTGIQTTMK